MTDQAQKLISDAIKIAQENSQDLPNIAEIEADSLIEIVARSYIEGYCHGTVRANPRALSQKEADDMINTARHFFLQSGALDHISKIIAQQIHNPF